MTEQIIIDGVDVAGCKFYDGEFEYSCKCSCTICERNQENCYFKQLKRLQEENKELKEQINYKFQNYWHKIEMKNFEVNRINLEYKQTLEEIRGYCEDQNLKVDYTACEVLAMIDEVLNDN